MCSRHRISPADIRRDRGTFPLGRAARANLLLDVLNTLNDAAEESIVSDVQVTNLLVNPKFGQPNAFVDPRRVMLGVRLNLGR